MSSMTYLEELFKDRIVLQDGGMGTTLEGQFLKSISDTPLWSANVIAEDPESVVDAHMAFLRAGARIILTATYQCAFETFQRAGYSKARAIDVMHKGVELADEARQQYLRDYDDTEGGEEKPNVRVALSIGPYGATLCPTQEFDGYYPPPYGPRGYTPDAKEPNSFHHGEGAKEETAIQALAEFHYERLMAYASREQIWSKIDCLAFETVPLLREILGIRCAMGMMVARHKDIQHKPWWITSVFPGGKIPERMAGGSSIGEKEIVSAILGEFHDNPRPSGFGVNCTSVEFLGDLCQQLATALRNLPDKMGNPWLILYPNGGDVYDPVLRKWIIGRDKAHWAEEVAQVVRTTDQTDTIWKGIIVGGCCRTGPEEIHALSQKLCV